MKQPDPLNQAAHQAIDDITISNIEKQQLARARQRALSESKGTFLNVSTSPFLAYASVFLVLGLVTFSVLKTPSSIMQQTPSFNAEYTLMMGQDPIELYDDLEFYMWMELDNEDNRKS